MKPKIFLCALCVLCGGNLFGKIGDTEAQTEKALGKPLRVELDGSKTYAFGPFDLAVFYMDGKSESERFTRRDRAPIANKDLMHLLNYDSGGCLWGKWRTGQTVVNWESADKDKYRIAAYNMIARLLMISSDKYFAHYFQKHPSPKTLRQTES